jgi:hypothetical protein
MDKSSINLAKPKLEELSREQLVQLLNDALDRLKTANERIEALEKKLNSSLPPKLPVPFSVRSAEDRKKRQKGLDKKNKGKNKPLRSGRIKSQEKIDKAKRLEDVYPIDVDPRTCSLSHIRPMVRIEAGQALWVAYRIYRAPNGKYGVVPGALGRSEFGLEIILAIAHQVYALGLSFDKAIALQKFFQNLDLKKSQVDAMLHQLSRVWEKEFESLLKLLTNSIVVHADETSWSIKSVWAFLSEQSRVILFGVNKDAKTLATVLDPASYKGTIVSDNAAVYGRFSKSQKCWAHLLRKAIKLTLLDPKNKEYTDFADGAFQIFYDSRSLQKNQSISQDQRNAEIVKLDDRVLALCSVREIETEKLEDPTADSFRLLRGELLGLSMRQELFTFVSNPAVAPTNNEAERTLRDPATARRVGRTSKTLRGARRQTIIHSVLESIRTQIQRCTLQGVLNEIASWTTQGESCFTKLMKSSGLTPNESSVLDKLFPNKGKPLPAQLAAS